MICRLLFGICGKPDGANKSCYLAIEYKFMKVHVSALHESNVENV